ncbi:MAG: ribonuclease P protein subunit [Thermoplasmatota archaeon]
MDETRNMFLVDTEGLKKMVAKKGSRLRIRVSNGGESVWMTIEGDSIIFRPEDRTKRCERKPLRAPVGRGRSSTENQPEV